MRGKANILTLMLTSPLVSRSLNMSMYANLGVTLMVDIESE